MGEKKWFARLMDMPLSRWSGVNSAAPDGVYKLRVMGWKEATSKAGNLMWVVRLQFVDDGCDDYEDFREYILMSDEEKMQSFEDMFGVTLGIDDDDGFAEASDVPVIMRTYKAADGTRRQTNCIAWPSSYRPL